MELLFLIGVAWACSRSWEALRKPASAQWAKYQKARQGTTPAQRAKARSARMAVAGYWAGEFFCGLPHARHGWAKGWSEHKLSWQESKRDHAQAVADHENQIARIRAEIAAHRHRLQVTRERNGKPSTMTDQLDAEKRRIAAGNGEHDMARSAGCTDPDCSCHASDPPLADGQTPGNGPVPGGHIPSPNGRNTGGNVTTPNGSGGDMNYDTTVELCDELQAAAEEAANTPALDKALGLADQLGAVLNNDSAALSKASDVARDAQAGKAAMKHLVEDSAAMKDHIVSNYGPIVEATDASAGTAPEPDFVDH